MIANIDENFGKLRRRAGRAGNRRQHIVIFMTDNGTSGGVRCDRDGFLTRGYNAGMRGQKAWYYDGGHRVPFFFAGRMGESVQKPRSMSCLWHRHLPDARGPVRPVETTRPGLRWPEPCPAPAGQIARFPDDRVHFEQFHQGTAPPDKWENLVMTRQWRLIRGRELYDIQADPGQRHDVAQHSIQTSWSDCAASMSTGGPDRTGTAGVLSNHHRSDAENPTRLDAMDVMGDVAWNQTAIIEAQKSTGRWAVQGDRPGRYRFALRRWPAELGLTIGETQRPRKRGVTRMPGPAANPARFVRYPRV